MLLLQFQPPSKVRSLRILSALTQLKGFNPKEPYLSQILELERGFEVSSGEAVQSSLKSALLLRALSGNMRQHIAANLPEDASYATLRETILRYERTQFKWDPAICSAVTLCCSDSPASHLFPRMSQCPWT